MAKTTYQSVDQYIGTQPDSAQNTLQRVRITIQKALPTAEEVISYQIPAYRTSGGLVIFFAGWKKHYSLYPVSDRLLAQFKDELAPYEANGKGTLRLPLSEPVPEGLIARIVKFRAKEVAELAKAKQAKTKKKAASKIAKSPAKKLASKSKSKSKKQSVAPMQTSTVRTELHKDGSIRAKGKMVGGELHGYWEWFRNDGTKMRSGYFTRGQQTGEWTTYDKTGKIHKVTTKQA